MFKIKTLLIFIITFSIYNLSPILSQPLELVEAFPNLTFTRPVLLTHSNDGTDRIFILEQRGVIKVFPNDSNISSSTTFMDIVGRVDDTGNEMGLLGLAFHPDYANNRYFYVDYTDSTGGIRKTRISRFTTMAGNPNQADTSSELVLLEIPQPYSNHNGGMIFFGLDGFLYIGMGDGGSGGDPQNNAQNLQSLLGKILRIDVDTTVGAMNYGIPQTNPFYGNPTAGKEEIFAIGMRNPWRFSQDHVTGEIWCGDVGQDAWEEVDLIENGNNYGWRCYEGNHTYNTTGCLPISNYTFPVKEYANAGGNCSVTGGYIYRGTRRPDLVGRYIYADYCSGKIWKFLYQNGNISEEQLLLTAPWSISSFGVDQHTELYIVRMDYTGSDSRIYKFNADTSVGVGNSGYTIPNEYSLKQNYPNPFNPGTNIAYHIPKLSNVKLMIYDAVGKETRTLVNTSQLAGNYEVRWNGWDDYGNEVASGVYFYSLKSGDFNGTKMMLLIK